MATCNGSSSLRSQVSVLRTYSILVLLIAIFPGSVRAGRKNLPQGDQSTLLCRCQAVWEDLYRNDGPRRSLLAEYFRPFQKAVGARNRNKNPRDNNAQVDRNGYIIVDGLTVLPDTRPVCKETRQRKREAGVHRRNLAGLEVAGNRDETEQAFEEDEGRDSDLQANSSQGSEVDGRLGVLRPPKQLQGRRRLKGSKGGGKGKGGKGGGSKGGGDGDWGWGKGKGKGGGSKNGGGSKGGDWGWGKGKGGSKGSSKGSKGGSKGNGKGKGMGMGKGNNNNWRPPVFPCPRPPDNNNRPTRAPASIIPTSRITLEPTLSYSPTNVPSSNIIAPTVSPVPTTATTPRPSQAIPLEPTASPAGTAEPTTSLQPTGGGNTPAPSIGGTAEPTASLQPTGTGNTPAPSSGGTAEPTASLQPSGTGNTAEPTASLPPTGTESTPAPSVGGTSEPTASLQPTGLSSGSNPPSAAIPIQPSATLEPTGGETPAPSLSRAPSGPPVTVIPTISAAPTTTEAPTVTGAPTITGQPSPGPTVTAAPSTSSAPSGISLQRAFDKLGGGIPLWKTSAEANCDVSLGIHCSTAHGKACSELYYPASTQCPTTTQVVTFRFDPSSCSVSSANHTGVTCTDYRPPEDDDFLVQCRSRGGAALEVSPIIVSPGDTFTVQAADFESALPVALECTVTDSRGQKAQEIGLDAGASTSVMTLKNRVGSLTLEGCDDLHCLETIRYRYEVSNDGGRAMTVTSLTLRQNGGLNVAHDLTDQLPVKRLQPSEVATAEDAQEIDMCVLRNYETTVRAKGSPYPDNGKVCLAQRVFELEIGPPPATS